ncbi:LysR family transcriptional regulator [Pseudomonas fluorescens]|uniref:LysR family transcriptional regulator n=1 Tax=Pseudomonas fluorescens TaxID=294 RepID=A0A379I6J1_PSEFL|nr:LysR family transcriptional regulator [Pseudomonas fluorescens]
MRWLLARLSRFRHLQPGNEVQLTSAWMSIDEVDFNQEPFDCAVLLSDGHFPADWEASYLFPELLIPVGAPNLLNDGPWGVERLASAELLHPTPDRRDWRRWLQRTGLASASQSRAGRCSILWSWA